MSISLQFQGFPGPVFATPGPAPKYWQNLYLSLGNVDGAPVRFPMNATRLTFRARWTALSGSPPAPTELYFAPSLLPSDSPLKVTRLSGDPTSAVFRAEWSRDRTLAGWEYMFLFPITVIYATQPQPTSLFYVENPDNFGGQVILEYDPDEYPIPAKGIIGNDPELWPKPAPEPEKPENPPPDPVDPIKPPPGTIIA